MILPSVFDFIPSQICLRSHGVSTEPVFSLRIFFRTPYSSFRQPLCQPRSERRVNSRKSAQAYCNNQLLGDISIVPLVGTRSLREPEECRWPSEIWSHHQRLWCMCRIRYGSTKRGRLRPFVRRLEDPNVYLGEKRSMQMYKMCSPSNKLFPIY